MSGTAMVPAENTRDAVVRYVERGATLLSREGLDAACAAFHTDAWRRGDWYVFILAADGEILCHPARADMVGKRPEAGMVDPNGVPFGAMMVREAWNAGRRGWVEYSWRRADGSIGPKSSFVIGVELAGGGRLIVGSGGYELAGTA